MDPTPTLQAYFAPVVSLALSAGIVRWLVAGAARRFALDQPNERSLHSQPVPRLGGAGILCGTLAGWALVRSALTPSLWAGAVLLGVVSLVEDIRGVPMVRRFLAHFVAASYFAYSTLAGTLPWPLLPIMVIGIMWVTNLYNFMDGSDGLAGGMAVFGFGAYALGAWQAGATGFAIASACISTSACAFLFFNFAPARIFMGDIGSIPLGFLAASFGLFGWRYDFWPSWFPFVVFSPFLVDASVTLVARQLRGEKVWRAHRSHYYQRLVLIGWGHRKVAVAEYGLMAAVAASSLATIGTPWGTQVAVVAAWAAIYIIFLHRIDVRWRRFNASLAPGPSATPGT
jgi:UDP-N-acetylmuramyl pentapeptide phosphotransferase/UDP-N-acetylglucosamine-1-phosphate transferase